MPAFIDLTGQRFSELTVLRRIFRQGTTATFWECLCDCGETSVVNGGSLKNGNTKSCGHARKTLDIVGQTFGRLTVIRKAEENVKNKTTYVCQCSCGKQFLGIGSIILSGKVKSCGCLNNEIRANFAEKNTSHGMSYSPEYRIWADLIQRCTNQNNVNFYKYGQRGISVCQRWLSSFEDFYRDMGPRPSSNHSIDRIDNNGNYEPGNCRWATLDEQANNKRSNIVVNYNDRNFTISQLSREVGMEDSVLRNRLQAGWSVEDAIQIPKKTSTW